jgi:hypothetical protein
MGAAMRVRLVAIAVLAVAALASFAVSAGAAAGGSADWDWIDFELKGSNGYTIHVSVNPRRHLNLQVSKEDFFAEYLTRDELAATDRVRAKLRGLGTISVRFHPRGQVRRPTLPGCEKQRPAVQPGVVRGTIRFAGEQGYTEVRAREAEAAVEEPKRWTCRYAVPFEPRPRQRDWVSKFTTRGDGVYFLARKYGPNVIKDGEVIYLVEAGEAYERVPGRAPLTIYRHVSVPAPASTFRDAHPEHLTLLPPAPFSGTGSLARTPESVFTWRGDLSVQFPGIAPIPLAGPGFEPDYCLREVGCIQQHLD